MIGLQRTAFKIPATNRGKNLDCGHVGDKTIQCPKWLSVLQRNLLPPSSGNDGKRLVLQQKLVPTDILPKHI